MLTAILLALASPAEFLAVEVLPNHEARIGGRDHVYYATGSIYTDGNISEFRDAQLYRSRFDGTGQKSLLDKRHGKEITKWVENAAKDWRKDYRLLSVVHDRFLVTRASGWGDSEKVRIIVVDAENQASFEFAGLTRQEAHVTTETVMAVGSGFAVLNHTPPVDVRKPLSKEPTRMFLMRGQTKTDIGPGMARGADLAGRIYASVTLDAEGKPTYDRDPNGTPTIKMYEKGTWTTLDDGHIRHVRGDGAMLVRKKGGYEFIYEAGEWKPLKAVWGMNLNPTFLADNGDILLLGRGTGSSPMPAFEASIWHAGQITDVKKLLPSGSEISRAEMAPDGSVLVQVRSEPASKTYLITRG